MAAARSHSPEDSVCSLAGSGSALLTTALGAPLGLGARRRAFAQVVSPTGGEEHHPRQSQCQAAPAHRASHHSPPTSFVTQLNIPPRASRTGRPVLSPTGAPVTTNR